MDEKRHKAMIHNEICTYEVAKLAKEKGFPQDPIENDNCQVYCWDNLRKIHSICISAMWYTGEYNREDMYAAPTQSLLQRWLREEKGIIIDVVLDWSYNIDFEEIRYQYRIGSIDRMTIEGGNKTKGLVFDKRFTTYELALEDALAYSLKNLV